MKNHNKTRFLTTSAGAVLVFFQLVFATASADYRGYWVDAVRNYQGEPTAYHYPEQPAAYQDYGYVQEPVWQEPAYLPPVEVAPLHGDNSAPAGRPLSVGKASYYGNQYNGRPTASGETYNMHDMTAAHPDLPFGTPIRVTNLQNGRSVMVRVNDRGPFKPGRVVDVSLAAAEQLGLILHGTAEVQVEVLG